MSEIKCKENKTKFYEELEGLFNLDAVKIIYQDIEKDEGYKDLLRIRDKFVEQAKGESKGMGSGRLDLFGHCSDVEYFFGQPEKLGEKKKEQVEEGEEKEEKEDKEHREFMKNVLKKLNASLGHDYEYLWRSDIPQLAQAIEKEKANEASQRIVTIGVAILKFILWK